MQQGIVQTRVEQPRFVARVGQFAEQLLKALQICRQQTAAGFAREGGLQQKPGTGIDGGAPDGATSENRDPHGEIRRLLHKHMLLGGEKPQQVPWLNTVAFVAEQIRARALRYKVYFKFGVTVLTVGRGKVGVLPDVSIKRFRKLQALQHVDKKR